MPTFLKVLLHLLYFVFVVLTEILLWQWLEPVIGGGFAILVVVLTFFILMMIYAAVFWKWRPSSRGLDDFFDGLGSDWY